MGRLSLGNQADWENYQNAGWSLREYFGWIWWTELLSTLSTTMGNPAAPEYQAALRSCLRWDDERNEPYLQLPSFPDLRLVPYRDGFAGDIVGVQLFI